MRTVLISFLLLASLGRAEDKQLLASQAIYVAGNIMDTASSWGQQELNPVLGQGTFGLRQTAIKGAIAGGLLAAEGPLIRQHPAARKPIIVANWVLGSLFSSLAVSNLVRRQ